VNEALKRMSGGLVVSVQAPPGSPLAAPIHMAALARAADAGGAVGIRAEGTGDVAAIKDAVSLPVIGLRKRSVAGSDVYITPTLEDALSVVAAGADLIAVDATDRPRPDGSTGAVFVGAVVRELGPRVVADVDSLDAGLAAREAGAAAVASTLAGYVGDTPPPVEPDLELVERLAAELDCPVLAEGRYATPEHVHAALDAGAFAVVVGTAITNPVTLTRRLADSTRRSADAPAR
jgi:putative N-acetylmannosamine-6-phosphate epimerase